MPNHVENDLFVSGESDDLRKFIQGLQKDEKGQFSILKSYYPMPEDIAHTSAPPSLVSAEEKARILALNEKDSTNPFDRYPMTQADHALLLAKYGVGDWYDWAHLYWGTKWGDYEDEMETDEYDSEIYSLKITFRSAWSPPKAGLLTVSRLFPELIFHMYSYEMGAAYQCGLDFQKGEILAEWSHEYYGNRGG